MKRKILSVLALLLALLCIPAAVVLAHPGRTDANGGHYNRSTGEYHYHHGYPAHQHPNGVCPYLADTSEDSTDTYYSSSQQDDDNVGGYFINDDVSSRYSDLSDAAEQLGGNYTTKVLTDISSAAYRDGYQEGYEDGLAYREKNPTAAAASTARGDAETISQLGGYTGKDYNVGVSNAYDEGYADAIAEMDITTSHPYQDDERSSIRYQIILLLLIIALITILILIKAYRVERKEKRQLETIADNWADRATVAEQYINKIKGSYYIPSPDDEED